MTYDQKGNWPVYRRLVIVIIIEAVKTAQDTSKSNANARSEAIRWLRREGTDWAELAGVGLITSQFDSWMRSGCPKPKKKQA